ncbi:hypothetical protein Tco_1565207 [Tanacetum coccineum]
MPLKHDLSGLDEFVNEPIVCEPTVKKPVVETSKAKASVDKPKAIRKNNGAPIIEDWVSDSEEEDVPQTKKEKKQMTHLSPKRNMVPKAVLMRSGLVSLTTARPVNTAQPKTTVNCARPMTNVFNKAHLTVKRPINIKTPTKNSNFNKRVNTVSGKNINIARPKVVVNDARPKQYLMLLRETRLMLLRPQLVGHIQVSNGLGPQKKLIFLPYVQGNPQIDLQDQGVIDSGCSRHMTGNMSYLTDFKETDGGYVAFGGNPKGGKITSRGTIKTGNLDFENVYFVREL